MVRTTRVTTGPATYDVELVGDDRVRVRAFGPGAEEVLDQMPDLLGLGDTPPAPDWYPQPLRIAAKRGNGTRFAKGHRVVEMLVPAVLQQLVSGKEAKRAFRLLHERVADPAPGPYPEMRLPLSPAQLRSLPPAEWPTFGILPKQGDTLRLIGERASRLEEASAMNEEDAYKRLTALRGLGTWTATSVMGRGMGFVDAVPLGDWNLPSTVAYNLAGEERADDRRMLELLEPYRGQRARILRLLKFGGSGKAPRRGPRMALRPVGRRPRGFSQF